MASDPSSFSLPPEDRARMLAAMAGAIDGGFWTSPDGNSGGSPGEIAAAMLCALEPLLAEREGERVPARCVCITHSGGVMPVGPSPGCAVHDPPVPSLRERLTSDPELLKAAAGALVSAWPPAARMEYARRALAAVADRLENRTEGAGHGSA